MVKILMTISVLFLSSQLGVAGEMYKWVDSNGITRFTNTAPPDDAKKVGNEINHIGQPITEEADKPDYFRGSSSKNYNSTSADTKKSNQISQPAEYRFNWSSPRVSGDELTLSGRVEGGESCKKLNVTVFLFDEKGNKTMVYCQASDVGGSGSRILEGKKHILSFYGTDWKVSSQHSDCLSK